MIYTITLSGSLLEQQQQLTVLNEQTSGLSSVDLPPAASQTLENVMNSALGEAIRERLRTFGITVPEEAVTFRVPPPEPGFTEAEIVIVNANGESEPIPYKYIDLCDVAIPPSETTLPEPDDDDLIDAYRVCEEKLQDLFCSDVTTTTGSGGSGDDTPDPVIRTFQIDEQENYYFGDIINISFTISGSGIYYLTYINEQSETISIQSGSFNSVDFTRQIEFAIPESESESVPFEFGLQAGTATDFKELTATKSVTQTTGVPEDVDVADAKKEIYVYNGIINRDQTAEFYAQNYSEQLRGQFFEADQVREEAGSFWIKKEDGNSIVFAKNLSYDYEIFRITSEKKVQYDTTRRTFGYVKDSIEYYPGVSTPLPPGASLAQQLEQTEQNLPPPIDLPSTGTIRDIVYDYQKPYTKKEFEKTNKLYNSRLIEIEPEYNFYLGRYEEIHKDLDETLLPNMYFIQLNYDFLEKESSEFTLDPDIKRLIALDSTLADEEPFAEINYYDYFARQYKSHRQDQVITGLRTDNTKNILIPYSSLPTLENYSKTSELYPMGVNVKFDTPIRSFLSPLMKRTVLGQNVFNQVVQKFKNNEDVFTLDFVKQELDGEEASLTSYRNRAIDATEFFELNETIEEDFSYFGNYSDYKKLATPNLLTRYGERAAFVYTLNDFIRRNTRTYQDIIDGKKCYTETVFYRIAKYRSNELIQNIWIPNDPDKKYLRYFDTQVKYDTEYTYRIFSYDFVIANEYRKVISQSTRRKLVLQNFVKLYFIENIYDEINVKIADLPPDIPQIQIHPFQQIDNKVFFWFNNGGDTRKQKEILIRDEDEELFQKARMSQDLEENDLIKFGSDDTINKYQIFRMTRKPERYEDFREASFFEVETKNSATSYIENIKPNTKYYYIFRAVDNHGQLSNPTDVHEIEMINESGTIYLMKRTWNFQKEEPKETTAPLKRYLMIKPSELQSSISALQDNYGSKEELMRDITLGTGEGKMWNKKYKLRLVSKNTKKVYDLNFKFTTNKQIIE